MEKQQYLIPCDACEGTGETPLDEMCEKCGGDGLMWVDLPDFPQVSAAQRLTDKSIVAIITSTRGNVYYATTAPVYKLFSRVEFDGYPAECEPRESHRFEVEYRTVEEVRP